MQPAQSPLQIQKADGLFSPSRNTHGDAHAAISHSHTSAGTTQIAEQPAPEAYRQVHRRPGSCQHLGELRYERRFPLGVVRNPLQRRAGELADRPQLHRFEPQAPGVRRPRGTGANRDVAASERGEVGSPALKKRSFQVSRWYSQTEADSRRAQGVHSRELRQGPVNILPARSFLLDGQEG
jgi:hypothetical protein